MNSINIYNNQKYKGAIIEYTCSDCSFSENFFMEFSGVSKVKPGNCEHFDMNFLLSSEKNSMNLMISFNCRICSKNEMRELFNSKTKNNCGSLTYKCITCGSGNITIGYLFQNEKIEFDDQPPQKLNFFNKNSNDINNNSNNNKNINLIFVYKNKEYKVNNVDREIFLPEAFHKLIEGSKYKELENLDIKSFLNKGKNLSKYKSIQQLNLKNGDKIEIEIRPYQGW